MFNLKAQILGVVAMSAVVGLAQAQSAATPAVTPNLTGTGKANVIPVWLSSTKLGDSPITEASGGISIANAATSGGINTINATTSDGTASAVYAQNLSTTGFATAIAGATNSSSAGATAIYGQADSATGAYVVGVEGNSLSSIGVGVQGIANGTGAGVQGLNTGAGGWGIKGNASGANSVGVEGLSPVVGVRGQSLICLPTGCVWQTGTAGQFVVASGGTLLAGFQSSSSGIWTSVFRVDSTGKGYFDGGTQTGGADFAESVAAASGSHRYEPGDLLALDGSADRQLTLAGEPYSTMVAGIYSTKPGVLATTHSLESAGPGGEVPLAVVGIVPCKVSAENGPIRRGDLLVTSSTPGFAMKGTDRSRMLGAIVGKAMEPLADGNGVIQVLVTLQ